MMTTRGSSVERTEPVSNRVNEMLVDVVAAKHLGNYELEIEFEDGAKGIVDFTQYLDRGGGPRTVPRHALLHELPDRRGTGRPVLRRRRRYRSGNAL